MGFVNTEKLARMDRVLGSGSPATVYLAALLTMPAEDGTGYAEPSGGSYARKAIANNNTNFPAAAMNGSYAEKKLAVSQSFAAATASWGTVKGYALLDSATIGAGTMIAFADAVFSPVACTVDAGTDLFTGTSHGLSAGMAVLFECIDGIMPTGITAATEYYVIASGLTANDFRVSATLGGSTVNVSSAGSGTIRVMQSFWKATGSGDTITVSANNLVFAERTAV